MCSDRRAPGRQATVRPPGLHITYVASGPCRFRHRLPGGPDVGRAVSQGAPAVHVVADPRSGLGRIRRMALEAGLLGRARPRALPRGAASRRSSRAARRASPDEPDAGAVGGLRARGFAAGPRLDGPGAADDAVLRVRAVAVSAARVDPHRGAGRRLQNPSAAGPGVHAVDRQLPRPHGGRVPGSHRLRDPPDAARRDSTAGISTPSCAPSAPRQSRASLQHVVGHLRAFLRFLASAGEIPTGLDAQIDTPRVYRGEQLPRALPWDTVRALLDSIDRTTPMGRRDYAMLAPHGDLRPARLRGRDAHARRRGVAGGAAAHPAAQDTRLALAAAHR